MGFGGERTLCVRGVAWLVVMFAAAGLLAPLRPAQAQEAVDVVVLAPAEAGAPAIRKTGRVLDWTAKELRWRSTLGLEETLAAASVQEVQTQWPAACDQARRWRQAGRLDDALAAFQQAEREETRLWAKRQILAEWSSTLLEARQIDQACERFLALAAHDPATRHFDLIPLPWRAMALDGAAQQRATAWLDPRQPPLARLLGASWLLATQRGTATAALTQLQQTEGPLAQLATIQLWRTRLASASAAEAQAWQQTLEQMPLALQPAGWYVLGDLWARCEQPSAAARAYLKVPILFRAQRAMAADALLAAAQQLEKMQQRDQALELYRELVRDYGHLPPAQMARRQLANTAGAP
jgi:tetratricopeptide (TPR) repeat protein